MSTRSVAREIRSVCEVQRVHRISSMRSPAPAVLARLVAGLIGVVASPTA
ncbi:hypothetical protein ACWCQS_40395 [Streptomyces sp. NPDC002076]